MDSRLFIETSFLAFQARSGVIAGNDPLRRSMREGRQRPRVTGQGNRISDGENCLGPRSDLPGSGRRRITATSDDSGVCTAEPEQIQTTDCSVNQALSPEQAWQTPELRLRSRPAQGGTQQGVGAHDPGGGITAGFSVPSSHHGAIAVSGVPALGIPRQNCPHRNEMQLNGCISW